MSSLRPGISAIRLRSVNASSNRIAQLVSPAITTRSSSRTDRCHARKIFRSWSRQCSPKRSIVFAVPPARCRSPIANTLIEITIQEGASGRKSEGRGQKSEVGSQRSEGRGQKSEVRSQRSEVRGQKAEVRSQRAEVRSQRSEVRGQKSEVRSQRPEGRGQKAEGRGQKAEVRRQRSEGRGQKSEGRSQK